MMLKKALNTREKLLISAADLIWERSFQATGVDDICSRADVAKGSFYHFFKSKSELAVAAVEHFWSELKETVFEPIFTQKGGLGLIATLVESIYEMQLNRAAHQDAILGCPFGNLGQEMARQDDNVRQSLDRIINEHYDYLNAALAYAQELGEIPKGDNKQRAKHVFALLEGTLLLAKITNEPSLFRDVMPAVRKVLSAKAL